MQPFFNPCEDCPLKDKARDAAFLRVGKMMGEEFTLEDYDRIHGSLNDRDRSAANGMESGDFPFVNGESCDGPKKAFFIGKLGCRGYGD